MSYSFKPWTRRTFIGAAATAAAGLYVPRSFAEELALTVKQTEGPFYPDKLPLDTDNDLLIINNTITSAVGQVTHLTGRVLDKTGNPMRNVLVEIWQCDSKGIYIHSADAKRGGQDTNFQGYGKFLTDSTGRYYFRTIKPVAYGSRTPHIHFKIRKGNEELLTTQMYVAHEAMNEKDGIYRSLGSDAAKKTLTVPFTPMADSKINELTANFDIVLGVTAAG